MDNQFELNQQCDIYITSIESLQVTYKAKIDNLTQEYLNEVKEIKPTFLASNSSIVTDPIDLSTFIEEYIATDKHSLQNLIYALRNAYPDPVDDLSNHSIIKACKHPIKNFEFLAHITPTHLENPQYQNLMTVLITSYLIIVTFITNDRPTKRVFCQKYCPLLGYKLNYTTMRLSPWFKDHWSIIMDEFDTSILQFHLPLKNIFK